MQSHSKNDVWVTHKMTHEQININQKPKNKPTSTKSSKICVRSSPTPPFLGTTPFRYVGAKEIGTMMEMVSSQPCNIDKDYPFNKPIVEESIFLNHSSRCLWERSKIFNSIAYDSSIRHSRCLWERSKLFNSITYDSNTRTLFFKASMVITS